MNTITINQIERDLLRAQCERRKTVEVEAEALQSLFDEIKRLEKQLGSISATDEDDDEDWDEEAIDDDPWMDNGKTECGRCGGDGHIELSEAPELWGEDCMMEKNRLVECPDCDGIGWVLE